MPTRSYGCCRRAKYKRDWMMGLTAGLPNVVLAKLHELIDLPRFSKALPFLVRPIRQTGIPSRFAARVLLHPATRLLALSTPRFAVSSLLPAATAPDRHKVVSVDRCRSGGDARRARGRSHR
jgi:hypothetical protein